MDDNSLAPDTLASFLRPDETVLWSTRKSQKLFAKAVGFTNIMSLAGSFVIAFQFFRLRDTFWEMNFESWLAVANVAAAFASAAIMLPLLLFCCFAFLLSAWHLARIYFDPHDIIYAITSQRIVQVLRGRRNPIREISLEDCSLSSGVRAVAFVTTKASLWQKLFGRNISIYMLGLSPDELQEAIGIAKRLLTKP
jgi:hypothetical protein